MNSLGTSFRLEAGDKGVPLRPCPSGWWGTANFYADKVEVIKFDLPKPFNDAAQLPRLVIALESPHVSEFGSAESKYRPQGPAQGTTGEKLRRNFTKQRVCEEIRAIAANANKFNLVLVNAIEYQCSMGNALTSYESRKRRDSVFRKLWFKCGGRKDFTDRILKLELESRDVLVNACTKGATKGARPDECSGASGSLREHVAAALKEIFADRDRSKSLVTSHPSSWLG